MSVDLIKNLLIAVLTVVAAVVLLMLAEDDVSSEKSGIPVCLDQETQDTVRRLMLRSYDQAFSHHTALLFDVWVKEYSAEPPRAINGMRNNISAYARAKAAAENWTFPAC